MKKAFTRPFSWLLIIVLVLSGCGTMTGRLMSVRQQVCDSDDSYRIDVGQGLNLTLKEPLLRDTDIVFLMDSPPTHWHTTTEGKQARYVFEQIGITADGAMIATGNELAISFVFKRSGNNYVMTRVTTSDIPPGLIDAVTLLTQQSPLYIANVCQTSINPFSRKVTLQLDEHAFELIPARSWVISWLGLPLESGNSGTGLSYAFRLKGNQADQPVAHVEARYDRKGDHPTEIDATYQRYHASVDIPEATITVKLVF